jgi:hypothetical protein
MPLIPQISLQGTFPQVQPLDYGQIMLQAEQVRRLQQQGALQQLALAQALEARQREQAFRQALASGQLDLPTAGAPRPMTQAQGVAPPLSGEVYARGPQHSPMAAMPALSPATQAPPGTTYERAPAILQPQQLREPPSVSTPPVYREIDWRKAYMLSPQHAQEYFTMAKTMRDYEQGDLATKLLLKGQAFANFTNLRRSITNQESLDQARQTLQRFGPEFAALLPKTYDDAGKAQLAQLEAQSIPMQQRLTLQTKILDDAKTIVAMVNDQHSLDQAKGLLRQYSPEVAEMLPATYSPDAIQQFFTRLQTAQQRLSRTSLTPVWGKDAQGNIVMMQPTDTGEVLQSRLPPGVTPLLPTQPIDVGTGTVMQPRLGGLPATQYIPKDVRTPAREKALGEGEGQLPGKIQAVSVEQLKAYRTSAEEGRAVNETLDEVERLLLEGVYEQSSTLPAVLFSYRNTGIVPYGYDGPQLARTQRVRELGARLTLSHGRLGVGVSNEDRETYSRSAGNFESGKTLDSMKESIKSMREIANRAITNFTEADKTFREQGRLPSIPTTRSQIVPPAHPAKSPYSGTPVDQLTPAQLDEEERWLRQQLEGR